MLGSHIHTWVENFGSLRESDWSLNNISYDLSQKNDGDAIEDKAVFNIMELETPELDFEMVLLKLCKHCTN